MSIRRDDLEAGKIDLIAVIDPTQAAVTMAIGAISCR